jgi:hypothetical protein
MGANMHRVHLAGTARNATFNARAAAFLAEHRAAGQRELVLYHDGGEWADASAVAALVPGAKVTGLARSYLQLRTHTSPSSAGWRTVTSADDDTLQARPITAELLREGLRHADDLTEELCSESPSVEWFLTHEFGYCIQVEDAIAGFCTTEYTRGERCELGVNTIAAYRRRGVATLAAAVTLQAAHRRGIAEIGWHCWSSNAASLALARKLGFQPVTGYSVWLCSWDGR